MSTASHHKPWGIMILWCRFLHLKGRVVLIQAAVKGRQQRRQFCELRAQCIRIQTHFRGIKARQLLSKMKAARTIQRHVRGFQTRKQMDKQFAAAVQIQVRYFLSGNLHLFFEGCGLSCCFLFSKEEQLLTSEGFPTSQQHASTTFKDGRVPLSITEFKSCSAARDEVRSM